MIQCPFNFPNQPRQINILSYKFQTTRLRSRMIKANSQLPFLKISRSAQSNLRSLIMNSLSKHPIATKYLQKCSKLLSKIMGRNQMNQLRCLRRLGNSRTKRKKRKMKLFLKKMNNQQVLSSIHGSTILAQRRPKKLRKNNNKKS